MSSTEGDTSQLDQYQNNLTPPIGTSFWLHQTKKVFSRDRLIWNDSGGQWLMETITWVTDIYTYVTGADPRQEGFQANNGLIYIVFVHTGKSEPSDQLSLDIWYRQTVTGPDAALPILQLPETGSGQLQSDKKSIKYTINFDQTMSMFKDAGNDTTNFEAKYIKDYIRTISRQEGTTDVSESQAEFGVNFTDIPDEYQDLPITALSVFQCDDITAFPMNFKFEASVGSYDEDGNWNNYTSISQSVPVSIKIDV